LADVVSCFEVIYDPESNQTVVEADREIVKSFDSMPDDPYDEETELSQYILR
jgi:hypothetical protein